MQRLLERARSHRISLWKHDVHLAAATCERRHELHLTSAPQRDIEEQERARRELRGGCDRTQEDRCAIEKAAPAALFLPGIEHVREIRIPRAQVLGADACHAKFGDGRCQCAHEARKACEWLQPTERGHEAWDRTVGAQARREALLSGVLSDAEKQRLHGLLRDLMHAFPDWKRRKHATPDLEIGEAP